jgi:hypothetical protein
MKMLVVAGMLAASLAAASAHEYRTVTWYADHPAAMHYVLKLCRDNAGLAPHNPNCINAEEAGTLVVQRQLNMAAGINAPPTSEAYWAAHPEDRKRQLWTCSMINKSGQEPDAMTAQWCNAARMAGAQ